MLCCIICCKKDDKVVYRILTKNYYMQSGLGRALFYSVDKLSEIRF